MRKNEDVLKYVYLAVIGLAAMGTAIYSIRKDIQIVVVICVFLFLLVCFLAALRFHTHRQGGFQIGPEKLKVRKWVGYLLLLPFLIIIILLVFPPSWTYIQTAIVGTPTATATPIATATATTTPTPPAGVESLPASLTQTPATCFCQRATDDLTIQCLITAESQAANEGSLELIAKIFSPNATIFRADDPPQTWDTPLEYYRQQFGDFLFSSAAHGDITFKVSMGKTQYYMSGSAGYAEKRSGGEVLAYNNDYPSDHWAFTKNEQGCWAVTYYEFNAAHLDFPRE